MNRRPVLCALALAVFAACGKSGERDQRPIEKIFYVGGAVGARFRVHGILADNARHDFLDHSGIPRVLTVPHYIVLENAEPPVLGSFEALDADVQVTLALGQVAARSQVQLPVGQVVTIRSDESNTPAGERKGPEVRIEVSADIDAPQDPSHIPFDATLGDIENTDLTSCFISDPLPDPHAISLQCTTPATFFIEEAKDFASGIFDKRNAEGRLRADLYVDGNRKDSDTGSDVVVVQTDL